MDELGVLHPNGIFLRREALEFGYRDRDLAAARAAGVLTRIRHGAYVASTRWAQATTPEDRYRFRGQAVMLSHGSAVALSHTSGSAAHGLRLWNVDMRRIHVTRLDGGPARCHQDIVYHADTWEPEEVGEVDEALVMSPLRSALGAAILHPVEQGLVTLDSLIDMGLADVGELHAAYDAIKGNPGTGRLQITVRLVEPGAQSAGESRSRFLCYTQHLPKPELRFEVYDESGELIGITDFAWPDYKLLGEFDGKIKYGRLLGPNDDPSEVVFAEKVREDRLREATAFAMIRLIWADLGHPRATAVRIRRLMRGHLVA